MNATGNFDAALQLAQPTLGTVLTAMHRAGSATHAVATVSASASGRDVIELLVNVPAIALDTTGVAAPPSVEARTSARILYHSRPVADPANVGINAACDVALRATARIGDGQTPAGGIDPATVVGDSYLFTDYAATLASDIAVHGVGGAVADEVRDSLLNVILAQRGTYPLAILSGSGIAQIGGAVIDRSPDTPLTAVGLNFTARAGASSTHLTTSFCHQDWALALSSDYLIQQLLARLDDELGGLPPPFGVAPILVDTSPGAQVFLDSFAVIVAAGQIDVAGAVRRVTPGPFGILTATWSATITLTLNAAQRIDATVSEPAVQLNEWYAVVGNFVTGGKIADTVASIVHDQLTGGLTGTGINTLITAAVGLVASSGTTAAIPIDVRATQVEVRPDAVVVHGTVTPIVTPEPPRAALTAIQGVDPGRLTFDAGGSWVPGGEITSVEFDFGDGSSQTFAGTNVALVTDHPYTDGLYNACVSITDQAGRTTRTCVAVQPGSLVVDLRDAPNWEFCSSAPTLTFDVTSSGSAIGGAIVTLSGNGWTLTAETDTHGTAQITVDPGQVQSRSAAGTPPSQFHLGAVNVNVSKPGWLGRQTIMWMVDCDSMIEAKLASIAHRNAILDRLAGYSALKDLLDKYPPGQRDLSFLNPFTQQPTPKPTPQDVAHLQLDHAVDLLTRLEDLITDGSDVLPINAILGIHPSDPDASAQMRQRMGELWQGVGMASGRYDERYGPNDPRP